MLTALKDKSGQKYDLKDLLRDSKLGGQGLKNPVTYADYKLVNGQRYPDEPYLHSLEDRCSAQSLDYIFEVQMKGHSSVLKVDVDSTKVEPFRITGEQYKFKHLSDHYGVST